MFANELAGIDARHPLNITDFRLVHPFTMLLGIAVSAEEMFIDSMFEQPENTPLCMVEMLSGKSI